MVDVAVEAEVAEGAKVTLILQDTTSIVEEAAMNTTKTYHIAVAEATTVETAIAVAEAATINGAVTSNILEPKFMHSLWSTTIHLGLCTTCRRA